MKKFTCLLLMLCLLLGGVAAHAIVLEEGGIYEEYMTSGSLDLLPMLGATYEEYNAYLEENGYFNPRVQTVSQTYTNEAEDNVVVLSGFYINDEGFSLYGFELNGRYDLDQSALEADGWVKVRNDFEGGLRWITFERTVGDAVYTLEIDSCDLVITGVSLEVNDIEAHYAAVAAEEAEPVE